ncbi:alpha/beta hydrolase [Bacteroidota bacterium]
MKTLKVSLFLLFIPLSVFSFKDESHFSKTFGTTRFFRVFTPIDYNPENTNKRYPVIYYFHGCGGSYERSGTYSYKDYGLTPPVAINRTYNQSYEFANNADFENVASSLDVIIVCVDGHIKELPEGCKVYFPSQAESWKGNYYNFSAYIRELFEVVDARYNTKTGPENRAVSGLSMGGHMAIWIAATNPHLFSSASQFCHSPQYYDVGELSYKTTVDVKELWRNLGGLPFRHTTTDRDYLRYFTTELYHIYSGSGFENEHYLADLCHHAAARIDLQFAFHRNYFSTSIKEVPSFSFINLYPDFEIRGYHVSSFKKGNGWIYLHNVTDNGLGIYTRKRLPWGKSLPEFDISITTPAVYTPNKSYTLSRYSYRNNTFTNQVIEADSLGMLGITSLGGIGEEIGINGDGLQPPVIILTDTVNENIYLYDNVKTPIAVDVINLSASTQTIDFTVSTMNRKLLTIIRQPEEVTIPAQSKIRINSFAVCSGTYSTSPGNTGNIKITSRINGVAQKRDHIIQVIVTKDGPQLDLSGIKIFDGRSENLALFKYAWNEWDQPMSSGTISEGSGNGNGKVEKGEVFSIWIQPPTAFDPLDISSWHPTIPINGAENRDIIVEEIKQHLYSTGRAVLSAQIRITRTPTKNNPIRIPLQTELLKAQPLQNDCHRNTADNFQYNYVEIILGENGTIRLKD